jgi:type IV secretory pathway protease TraF
MLTRLARRPVRITSDALNGHQPIEERRMRKRSAVSATVLGVLAGGTSALFLSGGTSANAASVRAGWYSASKTLTPATAESVHVNCPSGRHVTGTGANQSGSTHYPLLSVAVSGNGVTAVFDTNKQDTALLEPKTVVMAEAYCS